MEDLDDAAAERSYRLRAEAFGSLPSGGGWSHAGRDLFFLGANGQVTVNNIRYAAGEGLRVAVGPIPLRDLDQARRCYATTPSDKELRCALDLRPFALLRGERGQGRTRTAVVQLAGGVPEDQDSQLRRTLRESLPVSLLGLPAGLDPVLSGEASLAEGGYVANGTGEQWLRGCDEARVNRLMSQLWKSLARLVVLAGPDDVPPDLERFVVDHRPANADDIVLRHLIEEIGGAAQRVLADAEQFPDVARWLQAGGPSADAAGLARVLADWFRRRRTDPGAEPDLQGFHVSRLAATARSWLHTNGPELMPRAQAYVVAGAVLDGEAVSDVIIGAQVLERELRKVLGGPADRVNPLFDHTLRDWLHHVRIEQGRSASPSAAGSGAGPGARPVVKLPEPQLAWALLDVVWNEYDAARFPLLLWLKALAGWPDESVRTRTALALGHLATIDFETVREQVFDPWGNDLRARVHSVAAWALERCFMDPQRSRQVENVVRRWSSASSPGRRSIALRAWGTRIGVERTEAAFDGVRQAFQRRRRGELLAAVTDRVFVELYRGGRRQQVLGELVRWVQTSPEHRLRAREAFLRIGRLPAGPGLPVRAGAPPGRNRFSAQDPELAAEVRVLWANALLLDQHKASWRLLRRWLAPTDDPGLSANQDDLRRALADHHRLAMPLRFYEAWWATPASAEDGTETDPTDLGA